jgi:hypothetical protein
VNTERPDRLYWGILNVSEIRKTAPPKAGMGASFVAMRLLCVSEEQTRLWS